MARTLFITHYPLRIRGSKAPHPLSPITHHPSRVARPSAFCLLTSALGRGTISLMHRCLAALLAAVACTVLAGAYHGQVMAQTVTLDHYFRTLKRPDTPNTWLVAPADFVIKPDAVAPVFPVPVSKLRAAFKSIVLGSERTAIVAESSDGMHVVATTRLMRFEDDVRALFIPVGEQQSTIALYSASRVGSWDFGTNRRRVEGWIRETQQALEGAKR